MGWLNINPLARLFEFCMGMSAACFYERLKSNYRPGPVLGTAVEIVLLAAVAAGMFSNSICQAAFASLLGKPGASWAGNGVYNSLSFALLILFFSVHLGGISKCLSAPVLVLLGEISFSIYLLHQIIVRIYMERIASIDTFPAYFSFAYFWAVLLAVSYLLWLIAEKPSRKAILRIVGKCQNGDKRRWELFDGGTSEDSLYFRDLGGPGHASCSVREKHAGDSNRGKSRGRSHCLQCPGSIQKRGVRG